MFVYSSKFYCDRPQLCTLFSGALRSHSGHFEHVVIIDLPLSPFAINGTCRRVLADTTAIEPIRKSRDVTREPGDVTPIPELRVISSDAEKWLIFHWLVQSDKLTI
jgi:hypothetical protein